MTEHRIIEWIRKRPGLFLGENSITALRSFLNGFSMAVNYYNIEKENEKQTLLFPLNFWFMHEFAKVKCGFYESTSGWNNMILHSCDGNEAKALNRFFEMYDEFLNMKMTGCEKFTGTSPKNKPVTIYATELENNIGYLLVIEDEAAVKCEGTIFKDREELFKVAAKYIEKADKHLVITDDNIDFNKQIIF